MAFSLLDIRTGERKTFNTKDLLGLIGDSINDEISIGGDVYRLSSGNEIIEIDPSELQTSIKWDNIDLEIDEDGQNTFLNPFEIQDPGSVFLTINSILYTHGVEADYHIEGDRLYWHGGFDLETTDKMHLKTLQISINQ